MIKANYFEPTVREDCGNPLIEALPPFKTDLSERIKAFTRRNPITKQERKMDPGSKLLKLSNISNIYTPMNWAVNVSVNIDLLIREGYRRRNPLENAHIKQSFNVLSRGVYNLDDNKDPVGSGFLIGCSGMGKTTTVIRHLKTYPQVIRHESYHGKALDLIQIVWLHVDVPFDGSIKGFCFSILSEIDRLVGSNYIAENKRSSIAMLSDLIAKLCSMYCIGIIVIDESQNLLYTTSGKQKLSEFINVLSNKIGIPFYIIGTPKARELKEGSFHLCRRLESRGSLALSPYEEESRDWQNFIHILFEDGLYLNSDGKISREILSCFHHYCGGIPALAKSLLVEIQKIIFLNQPSEEIITAQLIEQVAKTRFPNLEKNIDDVHNQKLSALLQMDDWLTETPPSTESLRPSFSPEIRKDNKQHTIEDTIYTLLEEVGCREYLSKSKMREEARLLSLKIDPDLERSEYLPIVYEFMKQVVKEKQSKRNVKLKSQDLERWVADADSIL